MNKLKAYIKALPGDSARRSFAERCGTSLGHIRNTFYDDTRALSPEVAVAIERESDGAVPCEMVRPDLAWIRIPDRRWPHRRGRPAHDVSQTA